MEVNKFILSKYSSVDWASRVFLDVVGLLAFPGNKRRATERLCRSVGPERA